MRPKRGPARRFFIYLPYSFKCVLGEAVWVGKNTKPHPHPITQPACPRLHYIAANRSNVVRSLVWLHGQHNFGFRSVSPCLASPQFIGPWNEMPRPLMVFALKLHPLQISHLFLNVKWNPPHHDFDFQDLYPLKWVKIVVKCEMPIFHEFWTQIQTQSWAGLIVVFAIIWGVLCSDNKERQLPT